MVGHDSHVLPALVQESGNPFGQTFQFFRDLACYKRSAMVPQFVDISGFTPSASGFALGPIDPVTGQNLVATRLDLIP